MNYEKKYKEALDQANVIHKSIRSDLKQVIEQIFPELAESDIDFLKGEWRKMFKVGNKIYFAEEKKPYTIRACDDRFLVCTKPYNLKPKTVIYTIVDLSEKIRGTDGYCLSPHDYYTDEDCQAYLKELQEYNGEMYKVEIIDGQETYVETGGACISKRNRIELNITKIVQV